MDVTRGWVAQDMPSVPGSQQTVGSQGLSCASNGICLALGAGYNRSNGTSPPWAEVWNGSSWHVAPAPPTSKNATGNGSLSVSCASATWCIAVGGNLGGTVADIWNGSSWKTVSAPAGFNAIDCLPSEECEAVADNPLTNQELTTRDDLWNGSKWVAQNSVTLSASGAQDLHIYSLACYSASDCVAVGYYDDDFGDSFTFAMNWNGKSWKRQSTPNPGGSTLGSEDTSALFGVSCPVTAGCQAVGQYEVANTGTDKNAVEVQKGSKWTVKTSPDPSGGVDSYLNQVSCPATNQCIAVGSSLFYPSGGGNPDVVPEAMSWNGKIWKLMTT